MKRSDVIETRKSATSELESELAREGRKGTEMLTDTERTALMGNTVWWAACLGAVAEILAAGYIVRQWLAGELWTQIWFFLLAGPIVSISAFIHIRATRLERRERAFHRQFYKEIDQRSKRSIEASLTKGEQLTETARLEIENPLLSLWFRTIIAGAICAIVTWLAANWILGTDWLFEQMFAFIFLGHFLYKPIRECWSRRNAIAAGSLSGVLIGWALSVISAF